MELVILGSGGGPQPSAERGSPAVAVRHDGYLYVVDCGNGVAGQIVAAGHRLKDLRGVFLTHHHIDHNADYGNLVALAWTAGLVDPVRTFGPYPMVEMTDEFVRLNRIDAGHREALGRPELRALFVAQDIIAEGVVLDDGELTVSAARVAHPPLDAWGFRFDAGGKSIVISGDTAPCEALVDLASGADVLVHEAFSPDDLQLLTDGTNARLDRLLHHFRQAHTSAEDAGRVAARAGVRTLVLWHLIPRTGVDQDSWIDQASRHFDGEVLVSSDLMRVPV